MKSLRKVKLSPTQKYKVHFRLILKFQPDVVTDHIKGGKQFSYLIKYNNNKKIKGRINCQSNLELQPYHICFESNVSH